MDPMEHTVRAGNVFGWGRNRSGELSEEKEEYTFPRMIQSMELRSITQVAPGDRYTLVLDKQGRVLSLGTGTQGQLGRKAGPIAEVEGPLPSKRVVAIAAGVSNAAAITEQGELFEWGLLHYDPELKTTQEPSIEMHGLARRAAPMSERLRKMLAESEQRYLTSNEQDEVATRRVTGTDPDNNDQVGVTAAEGEHDNKQTDGVVNLRTRRAVVREPRVCESLKGLFIAKVALGTAHVLALSRDGAVFSKGYNDRGQLGLGHRVSRSEFTRIMGEADNAGACDIACGNAHSLVLIEGRIYSFGSNAFGQLGIGPFRGEQLQPTLVVGCEDELVASIASGDHHSLCVTRSGQVFSWGHAEYGQHGAQARDGNADLVNFNHMMRYFHTPRPVFPFSRHLAIKSGDPDSFVAIQTIASSGRYNLAIDRLGRLWSWGWNEFGVLGHGLGARWTRPQVIEDLVGSHVLFVAAGPNNAMAVTELIGSAFALSFSSLLPEPHDPVSGAAAAFPKAHRVAHVTYDLILRSTLSNLQAKEKDADVRYSVRAHSSIAFARCPALRRYVQADQMPRSGVQEAVLPIVLAPNVLYSLVQYLYCDHVRACPPHRMIELQSLAKLLDLPQLESVCAVTRFQRSARVAVHHRISDFDILISSRPTLLPSSFSRDMMKAALQTELHDVFLSAADQDEEAVEAFLEVTPQVPCGHTSFSWLPAGGREKAAVGHTGFSWAMVDKPPLLSSAQKDILTRYLFFDKLLSGSFREGLSASDENKRVVLHNLTPRGLSNLLCWMYTGESSMDPSTVLSVYATAKCFAVDDLADCCETFILNNVDASSASHIREFALDVNNARILQRCESLLNKECYK